MTSCSQAVKAITGKEQEYKGVKLPEGTIVKGIKQTYRKPKKVLAPDQCKTKCNSDINEETALKQCRTNCKTKHKALQDAIDCFNTNCVSGNRYKPDLCKPDRFTSKPCDSWFEEFGCDLWQI